MNEQTGSGEMNRQVGAEGRTVAEELSLLRQELAAARGEAQDVRRLLKLKRKLPFNNHLAAGRLRFPRR
jgi:hypothetical protein